jgi:prepilin-type processing-associated H-X9-DG protein
VAFAAFTSRLSGARWQTGRPAQVAAILAAATVWIVPHLAAGLDSELRGECKAAMRSLVASLQVYLATSDGKYPPEGRWSGLLLSQSGGNQRVRCPVASKAGGSYAFNSALANARQDALDDPSSLVVLFESDTGSGTSGGRELLPSRPRHLGGDHYAFADGHVEWLPRKLLGVTWLGNRIWAKEPDADWVIWEPVFKEDEEGADR